MEDDCDDHDNVITPLQDEDCDGFLTEVDCDDSDESKYNGSENCPEKSCWHILQKNNIFLMVIIGLNQMEVEVLKFCVI